MVVAKKLSVPRSARQFPPFFFLFLFGNYCNNSAPPQPKKSLRSTFFVNGNFFFWTSRTWSPRVLDDWEGKTKKQFIQQDILTTLGEKNR
jgi:hypothetical protein